MVFFNRCFVSRQLHLRSLVLTAIAKLFTSNCILAAHISLSTRSIYPTAYLISFIVISRRIFRHLMPKTKPGSSLLTPSHILYSASDPSLVDASGIFSWPSSVPPQDLCTSPSSCLECSSTALGNCRHFLCQMSLPQRNLPCPMSLSQLSMFDSFSLEHLPKFKCLHLLISGIIQ